jgi:GT2 family glycosyltransferase
MNDIVKINMLKDNSHQTIPDVSIIIVSFNTRELTVKCINCIKENSAGISIEIIVVDNGSKDGSADMIEKDFPWVRLIRLTENRGFAGGNIPAMKKATGKYILLLNSDAFIRDDTFSKTIAYMDKHPYTGILGCKLTNPDGSMQPSARMLPGPLNKFLTITGLSDHYSKSRFFGRVDFTWWDHSTPKNVGWVVGAYFLIRRETMESIGYLDDRYFLYFEEVDYCLSARRSGWDVVFYPYTEVVHLGGKSAEKSGNTFSENGKQILKIRINSEWKYYHKFYGWYYAIIVLGIEFFWNAIVYIKNLGKTMKANNKRENSKQIMQHILSTFGEVYRACKSM